MYTVSLVAHESWANRDRSEAQYLESCVRTSLNVVGGTWCAEVEQLAGGEQDAGWSARFIGFLCAALPVLWQQSERLASTLAALQAQAHAKEQVTTTTIEVSLYNKTCSF